MTVAILATSGMERRDLLIATAKLQLFQGQESIRGYKEWYGKCHTSHTASATLVNCLGNNGFCQTFLQSLCFANAWLLIIVHLVCS